MAEKDFEWLTPLLGFVGLVAGTLFLTSSSNNNNNNNSNTNNTLPPPPPPVSSGQKPGGCGCNKK